MFTLCSNNIFVYIFMLWLVNSFQKVMSDDCTYIKDIAFTVTTKQANGYSDIHDISSYSGCFVPGKISGNVEEITILDQDIFVIGNGSINGLQVLRKMFFIGCEIADILPGAFNNVPNLQVFHIRNGNLKAIKSGIFNLVPNIKELNFRENDISLIDDYAFSNLSSLKRIILANNDLTEVKSKWFSNSANIQSIDFSYNSIQQIEQSTFWGMLKLKEVYLDFNDIEVIEHGVFKDLKEMKHIGLSHNRLVQLDYRIFQNGFCVEKIFLNVNFLNFLSAEFMKVIRVGEISLDGNPWHCPCLDAINNWLFENDSALNITSLCARPDVPQCINSIGSSSHCEEMVNEELTESYINTLKSLEPRVDESCAKFD